MDYQRSASFLLTLLTLLLLAVARSGTAGAFPPDRATVWSPGIPGGIPVRTTVCATVSASSYGNGTQDATAGIQAAIDACPVGQVVQLSAGEFLVNGWPVITLNKGVVLRGAGVQTTRLRKTASFENPMIVIGQLWPEEAASVDLTANVAKGATSVKVTSAAGFSAGQLVLLDELTDNSYVYWGKDPAAAPGGPARGWFTRYDRPVGQMLEIASVSGNTVSFTTPLHIAFDTVHKAQLTRYTVPYGVRSAGLENLTVRGGIGGGNIAMRLAMYSWIKGVDSDHSVGDSVSIDSSFRCVLRDSYVHDTAEPYPGGNGYLLSVAEYTSDSLVENSIFINANKVMVMRATGGGNVIGYNYFDNGYIANYPGWVETGLNPSHMACPHFELFEGNQAFNADPDDTWGGAVYNTFFRNHLTGKRRSFDDIDNRRAAGLMWGHYYYSFVGNVLGTADQDPAPYQGFTYEDLYPWGDDPVAMWRIGYTPTDWNAPAEARVVNTLHRHGNFDYATNTVKWTSGYDQALPASLYLTAKPVFFGSLPWPWVDPTGAVKLYTLPARARFDAGTPVPSMAPPFGSFDTPASGATGVTGAIPVTGWALDDVGVTTVEIYRDPMPGEATRPNGKVYVGDATFVRGARPDVAAAYPGYPNADRAGWGIMLLTNMLPGQGNGPFTLYAYAYDGEGNAKLLGSKAITCSNATAIRPFGTIDTPGQGQTVAGNAYAVFGWALTPQPGTIPIDGSTIWVYVDGVPLGHPTYNLYRSDIATLFPSYANSSGPVGLYVLDTTALTNGTHTIAWSVTDDLGRTDGIGSRYFWVQN